MALDLETDYVTIFFKAEFNYDGPQHCKLSLVTSDDLKSMYSKHQTGGELVLWCDGRSYIIKTNKHKQNNVTQED